MKRSQSNIIVDGYLSLFKWLLSVVGGVAAGGWSPQITPILIVELRREGCFERSRQ
jgi:hypothetical protein